MPMNRSEILVLVLFVRLFGFVGPFWAMTASGFADRALIPPGVVDVRAFRVMDVRPNACFSTGLRGPD